MFNQAMITEEIFIMAQENLSELSDEGSRLQPLRLEYTQSLALPGWVDNVLGDLMTGHNIIISKEVITHSDKVLMSRILKDIQTIHKIQTNQLPANIIDQTDLFAVEQFRNLHWDFVENMDQAALRSGLNEISYQNRADLAAIEVVSTLLQLAEVTGDKRHNTSIETMGYVINNLYPEIQEGLTKPQFS